MSTRVRAKSADPRRRRVEALSTQNRGFTASSAAKIAKNEGSEKAGRGRLSVRIDHEIKFESSNGHIITGDLPRSGGDEARIKHFTSKMRQYSYFEYPEEWALCQYSLACIYYADRSGEIFTRTREGRAKSIETALYHFDQYVLFY